MQAAERLRRAKTSLVETYGMDAMAGSDAWMADKSTVIEFALSILPKGERPVSIDRNRPQKFDELIAPLCVMDPFSGNPRK